MITNTDQWAAEFFAAVDSRDGDRVCCYMTDDVRFQMANLPASHGVDALRSSFAAGARQTSSMTHTIDGVWSGSWERGQVIAVEARVRYGLPNGAFVEAGATSTLRLVADKVADYRIFMDPSAVFGATESPAQALPSQTHGLGVPRSG